MRSSCALHQPMSAASTSTPPATIGQLKRIAAGCSAAPATSVEEAQELAVAAAGSSGARCVSVVTEGSTFLSMLSLLVCCA